MCAEAPAANGRPHYVHAGHQCHLYATSAGCWVLSFLFLPDDDDAVKSGACMLANMCMGAVPVGSHQWLTYFEEEIAVTAREMDAADVAAVQEGNARSPPSHCNP